MRYFIVPVVLLCAPAAHANLAYFAEDCTSLDPDESHIYDFVDQNYESYTCLDPQAIIASGDLSGYDAAIFRTSEAPTSFNDVQVVAIIDAAVKSGLHLILEYGGLYLVDYLGLGTVYEAEAAEYPDMEIYFASKYTELGGDFVSPFLEDITEWNPQDIATGQNDPEKLILRLEASQLSYRTLRLAGSGLWYAEDYSKLVYTPGYTQTEWESDWCFSHPGVCEAERSVYSASLGPFALSEGVVHNPQGSGRIYDTGFASQFSSAEVTIGPIMNQVRVGILSQAGLVTKPPEPQKTPVIIIHGIIGSMSTELFCGDQDQADDFAEFADDFPGIDPFNILQEWSIDPILESYNGLIAGLELQNFPVEVFAYDWRRQIPVIVKGDPSTPSMPYLERMIDEVKAKYDVDKVDIVAHSMGGLVTREYIQNHYRGDIRKFVMIGTPNRGSLDTYRTWQKGNFARAKILAPTIMESLLENMKEGCGQGVLSDAAFVRSNILSVKQLLPTFDYFRYSVGARNEHVRQVEEMCHQNTYLAALNAGAHRLVDQGIDMTIIASINKKTAYEYGTNRSQRKSSKCGRETWADRRPATTKYLTAEDIYAGDGRVLYSSAYPFDTIPAFTQIPVKHVGGKHGDLPSKKGVIRKVRRILDK